MNGAHDMGGVHGFGPVVPEVDEPLFHADWERTVLGLVVALGAAGCAWTGPGRLNADQTGFTAALGDGLKRQMLLNMVRLRYADVPAFVAVSQLISGYTLQSTGQLGLNAYPNAAAGNPPETTLPNVVRSPATPSTPYQPP